MLFWRIDCNGGLDQVPLWNREFEGPEGLRLLGVLKIYEAPFCAKPGGQYLIIYEWVGRRIFPARPLSGFVTHPSFSPS